LVIEAFCKDKLAPLSLRLALGLVAAYHGFLKIAANGGMSWAPGLGVGWQLVIAWGEFVAGVAVLFGFRCRVAAAAVVLLTTGTLLWWYGWALLRLPLASLEPTLLFLLLGVSLVLLGAGELSLDGKTGGLSKPSVKLSRKK
jgi:uncharacterized membrane protein YphA (DoxX/SURF4 family)